METKLEIYEVINQKGDHFIFLRNNGSLVDCAFFDPNEEGKKLEAIKKMVDLGNKIKENSNKAGETFIASI